MQQQHDKRNGKHKKDKDVTFKTFFFKKRRNGTKTGLHKVPARHPNAPRRPKPAAVTKVELAALKEVTLTFDGWLMIYDGNPGRQKIKDLAWDEARGLATTPVHLTELYFRAPGRSQERSIIARISKMRAEAKQWREAALALHSGPLIPLIVKKVPRATWELWLAEITTVEGRAEIASLLSPEEPVIRWFPKEEKAKT